MIEMPSEMERAGAVIATALLPFHEVPNPFLSRHVVSIAPSCHEARSFLIFARFRFAATAFTAISTRCSGVNAFALASPPKRPNVCAWGFFIPDSYHSLAVRSSHNLLKNNGTQIKYLTGERKSSISGKGFIWRGDRFLPVWTFRPQGRRRTASTAPRR